MIAWLVYIIGSWLLADFIAGVFHWLEDSYFDADTPIVGKLVGGPNKMHHASPTAFLLGSYWHRNYTTIIPAAIACVVCLWLGHWLWLTMAFLTQANQIHCYGHQGSETLLGCVGFNRSAFFSRLSIMVCIIDHHLRSVIAS